MNTPTSPLTFKQGVVIRDRRPCIYISADYPYYRDDAHNWPDRLDALKSLGLNTITIYIPWRHHQTRQASFPDFTGRTQANRNVLGFLALCKERDITVIAKPGPFIHAEVNYGGLPDWVCPLNNPAIEALQDASGASVLWYGARLDASGKAPESWPLPAPFSLEFMRLARIWLQQVGKEVIRPQQAPAGPITAIQVANEGIFSNGQHAPWAYDYSPSGLALFSEFLAEKYQSLSRYNKLNNSAYSSWQAIPEPRKWDPDAPTAMFVDWGEFSAYYMEMVFQAWSKPLKTSLPVLINQNPPLGTHYGLDAWFSRVEPERWPSVHYGFTNWVGDVSANPSAFHRYVLTAKRSPGPNMEENWGFAELYDPAYADAATSFYQTLVILNNGATGFNVYTGVATAFPDKNIEVVPKAPYPDEAPITAAGELTPKAEIVRWMVKFFDHFGAEFLACRTEKPAAWGYYLPQARHSAWSPEGNQSAPQHGAFFGEFQHQMRSLHLDYGLANLESSDLNELLAYPHLFVAGGRRMAADVQQKLVDYASRGGKLSVCGTIPQLGETGAPCTALNDAQTLLRAVDEVDAARLLAEVACPNMIEGEADIWVRSHPERDVHYITLLIPANGKTMTRLSLRVGNLTHQISLSATPSGGAILRVENGRVTDAIIKGHNAFLGYSVPPRCAFDSQSIGLDTPGDMIRMGDWTASLVP